MPTNNVPIKLNLYRAVFPNSDYRIIASNFQDCQRRAITLEIEKQYGTIGNPQNHQNIREEVGNEIIEIVHMSHVDYWAISVENPCHTEIE